MKSPLRKQWVRNVLLGALFFALMATPILIITPIFQAHSDLSLSDTIALGALVVALYTLIITALIAIIVYGLQRGDAIEDRNSKVASTRTATRLSLESAFTGLILCVPNQRRKGAGYNLNDIVSSHVNELGMILSPDSLSLLNEIAELTCAFKADDELYDTELPREASLLLRDWLQPIAFSRYAYLLAEASDLALLLNEEAFNLVRELRSEERTDTFFEPALSIIDDKAGRPLLSHNSTTGTYGVFQDGRLVWEGRLEPTDWGDYEPVSGRIDNANTLGHSKKIGRNETSENKASSISA